MSNPIIKPLSPNTKINKPELIEIINTATKELGRIDELYRKFFVATSEEKPTLVAEIEAELLAVKEKYTELFIAPDGGSSKINALNDQIVEIEAYHQKLLEGETSVEADIQ